MSRGQIIVLPDAAAVAREAARRFVESAATAIAARGRFLVALSGGSTPRLLHHMLAEKYAPAVEWSAVHLFWGDERCVPPTDPQSNYGMARETLLDHVPIPPANVHRLPGEMGPETAARDYATLLRQALGPSGRLDLVFLGLGPDRHTASLFPGAAAIHEQKRWVMAHYVPKLGAYRLTMTPALLNRARQVIFLVVGPDKAEALASVHDPTYEPDERPAQAIRPKEGELTWLVDEAAASNVKRET